MPSTLMAVGSTSLIVIAVVALIIFNFQKSFRTGKAMGSDVEKEFKDATKGLATDDDDEDEKDKQQKKIEFTETKA